MSSEAINIQNAAYCHRCGTNIVSTHRHDFAQCPNGGGAFRDGGSDYIRSSPGNGLCNLVDISVTVPKDIDPYDDLDPEDIESYMELLLWGVLHTSSLETYHLRIMDLTTPHLKNILNALEERDERDPARVIGPGEKVRVFLMNHIISLRERELRHPSEVIPLSQVRINVPQMLRIQMNTGFKIWDIVDLSYRHIGNTLGKGAEILTNFPFYDGEARGWHLYDPRTQTDAWLVSATPHNPYAAADEGQWFIVGNEYYSFYMIDNLLLR